MREAVNQIVLNGSHGEGGGALVRTSVAMASVTQQPFLLHNVRGALRKPGLTAEDLTYIELAADACSATVGDAHLGSTEFSFAPSRLPRAVNGQYDIHGYTKGTVPGNAVVIAGSVLPILARAKALSEVVIRGETHNEKTVCFDAFNSPTLAAMRRFGVYAYPRLIKVGFGYGAKGEVALEVEPSVIEAQEWPTRGGLVACGATVTLCSMGDSDADEAVGSLEAIASQRGVSLEIDVVQCEGGEPGATVTVWGEFESAFGSGTAALTRERTMTEVANNAFLRFIEWFETDATLDQYLADQVLVVAAQAEGRTVFTTPVLSKRFLTMAWVVRQFMPIHVTVLGREGGAGTVTIER